MKNEALFLKACRREKAARTPVWFMRQAGRYMACYRQRREKYSMLELCKNPALVAETTVEAVERLGVDAAILFSDLLLIAEPLGISLDYAAGGPRLAPAVKSAEDVARLRAFSVDESLGYVFEAVRQTKKALPAHFTLIGFSGAPFTLATYLIEGGSPGDCAATKIFMRKEPAAWSRLMNLLAGYLQDYLNRQAEAGADALQVFDSWAGCLPPEDYRRYVLPHSQTLFRGLTKNVPVIHFGTKTAAFLELMKEAGGSVIGLDSQVNLGEAWKRLGNVAVMGNLDPLVLLQDRPTIRGEILRILGEADGRPGHIFNLGHGVLKDTPEENVRFAADLVKELSCR